MPIPFTQYLRPNGRRTFVEITRPEPIEKRARAILDAGLVFECEELFNGMCSFTVTDAQGDLMIELCPNGPNVPATVDKLVNRFYETMLSEEKDQQT